MNSSEIRALRKAARELPKSMEPPADLWASIRAQTTKTPVRSRPTRYYLAAAAAVFLIVSSSTITYMLTRRQPAVAVTQANPNVQLVMKRAEKDYTESVKALQTLIEARRGSMDTATLNLLDRHMKLIDGAINDAKKALSQNPDNEQLPHMITGAYERKITMMKRALRSGKQI